MSLSRGAGASMRPSRPKCVRGEGSTLFGRLYRQARRVHLVDDSRLPLWRHVGTSRGVALATECGEVCVSCLLGARRPATVLRRVWAVVVDAVQRVLRRGPAAHIGQERGIGVAPSFAHENAAPAIAPVADVIRIPAAGFHAFPDFVLGRRFADGAFSVSAISGRGVPAHQAAASFTFVVPQKIARQLNDASPAVAPTQPSPAALVRHGYELIEALAGEIAMHLSILQEVAIVTVS